MTSNWWHLFHDCADDKVYFVIEGPTGESGPRIPIDLSHHDAIQAFEELEKAAAKVLMHDPEWW